MREAVSLRIEVEYPGEKSKEKKHSNFLQEGSMQALTREEEEEKEWRNELVERESRTL